MKKKQTTIIEKENQIYITIPIESLKIKKILFVVNEKIKNNSEKINELIPILSNMKQEIIELKEKSKNNDEIIGLKEENKKIKEEFKNMKENNLKEIKDLNAKLKNEINKINENKEKELKKEINELKSKIIQLINENKQNIENLLEYNREKDEKDMISNLDSLIIKDKDIYNIRLKNWIYPNKNKEIQSKLLYRLSRDGNNYEIFHKNCDNKGPTLILIKIKEELIIGGFTLLNWDSKSKWKKDDDTFIFSLSQNKKYIKKEKNSNSIFCLDNYGPMFDNFGFECKGNNKGMKKCKFNPKNVFKDSYDIIPNYGKEIYFDVEEVEIYSLIINYIICEYNIKKEKINEPIQIINSYEEAKRQYREYIKGIENEKEIKENCEIYLNNKSIDFCYKYKLTKEKNEIKIISKTPLTNINWMFSDCSTLTSLNLSNFNTNNITSMCWMFYNCTSLTSLNLSNFNTNNVKDMERMFLRCTSLKSLNLSNFNTKNVTNMYGMFSHCYSLKSLNLSNFNTNNVTSMVSMFSFCSSLKSLNLSTFNTNNVTSMGGMFGGCSSLTSLNLSNFNTDNVTSMGGMFWGCSSLNFLDLSNFNSNNVTKIICMFTGMNEDCNLICSDKKILNEFSKINLNYF